jgi:hypothetical protein
MGMRWDKVRKPDVEVSAPRRWTSAEKAEVWRWKQKVAAEAAKRRSRARKRKSSK